MRTVYRGLHWGTNEIGDQWELYNQGYTGGPMRWGTNENRVEGVTRGDQWEWGHRVQTMWRGLMNWGTSQWEGTNGMGDQWDGGPMEWAVRGCWLGDQWDGGPVRWGTIGIDRNGWTNEKGDQWEGGPMSSNNVVGDLWIGGPMRRGPMRWGPMRWGANESGDQWDGGPMKWVVHGC